MAPTKPAPDPAVTVTDVTVDFGGFRALDAVSLEVPVGQRRAIVGPNGAGKTTLLNVVSGAAKPTGGAVALFGAEVTRLPEHRRAQRGISRTRQITDLFGGLTVADNLRIAAQGLSRAKWMPYWRRQHYDNVSATAMDYLVQVGLADRPAQFVSRLSYGEQRQLELAMALANEPRVLLLDEPAAGLAPAERTAMATRVKAVAEDVTILMIEHDMDLVLSLADEITVLDQGTVVASGSPAEIQRDEDVRRVYLG